MLAFGSAKPRTEERYDAGSFTPFYGRALAVVRVIEPGNTQILITGKSLVEIRIDL